MRGTSVIPKDAKVNWLVSSVSIKLMKVVSILIRSQLIVFNSFAEHKEAL